MNTEIRKARFDKKHADFAQQIRNLRSCLSGWTITQKEYEKEIQKIRKASKKLDEANPDLAALALEVRRSHGFPG